MEPYLGGGGVWVHRGRTWLGFSPQQVRTTLDFLVCTSWAVRCTAGQLVLAFVKGVIIGLRRCARQANHHKHLATWVNLGRPTPLAAVYIWQIKTLCRWW